MAIKAPYKLYPVQKEVMADLNTWWKSNKKHVLLQAPTGSGKTVLHLLFGLLKLRRGHRIVYFSREHAQIEQCTYELSQLIELNEVDVRAVHIAGKSHSCLQPEVRDMGDNDAQDIACEEYTSSVCGYTTYIKGGTDEKIITLRKEHKNVFYSFNMHDSTLEGKRLITLPMTERTEKKEIMDLLFKKGIATNERIMMVAEFYALCPRTLQKWAMENANIIFAPYNYMVIPRFEAKPDSDIYIIDESHNLDSNLTSMQSNKAYRKTFQNYFRYIQRNIKFSYLNILNTKVIRRILDYSKGDFEINGPDLHRFLDTIEMDDVVDLSKFMEEIVNKSTIARKFGGKNSDDKVPKHFKTMDKFLQSLLRLKMNYKSGFITMKDDFLNINFVDTDVIFRSISAKAHRVIISSGSLYPKHMASYLGLNKSNSTIFEYNPPHKNRHNISSIIGSYGGVKLSTKYTNRKESVFKAYAKMIQDVYQENAHGTLVYFTSYAYRNKIGGYLKEWNIPYFEPDTVASYRETIHAGKRAVFMSAFRGLGSEGWNFGDDQSRAIILIGIPYLPTGEMQVKAQQIYYNSRKQGLGNTWYNQKAILWLMQAFGRGIRHKDDFTTVYFADNRIPRMRQYFIGWVKEATNWKIKEWLNGRPKIRLQV